MKKHKKSDIAPELFKYLLVAFFSAAILVFGYKIVNSVMERGCATEIAKFELDLKGLTDNIGFGEKVFHTYNAPCGADEIYFIGKSPDLKPEYFNDVLLIKESVQSSSGNNIFLMKEGKIKSAFHIDNLEIEYPSYKCLVPKFGKLSFFLEGTKNAAFMSAASDQPECTLIPVDTEDGASIPAENPDFECPYCTSDHSAVERAKGNSEIGRTFTYEDGKTKTKVEITIRIKDNIRLRKFVFIESLPKECIRDLTTALDQNIDITREEATVTIQNDPLIAWSFDEINGKKTVSYRLNVELSEDCREMLKGTSMAQIVEQEEAGNDNSGPKED